MSYIIKDYSKWKELNERYKAGETFGSRVVLISIDDSSFKIKAIKEIDIVDANGKMIPTGWAALRDNFLKTNIPASDPAVKKALDTKTNFIIYDVNKANDRKQVITFTVKPRTEAPGLPPTTEYVSQDELQTLIKDPNKATILAQASQSAETKTGTQVQTGAPTTTGPIKLAKPISLEAIKGADGKATYDDQGEVTGPPVFKAFDDMLVALSKMPEVAKNTAFINLKKEIKAGQLGDSAVTFAKALIVGFGLKDKYGDPLEIINQAFVDKLSTTFAKPAAPATAQNASRQYYLGLDGKAIYEADQTVIGGGQTNTPAPAPAAADSGFDMTAFLKALGGTDTGAVNTGDIKLPEGGIKKGVAAKGDAELKKAQQLIIDKLGAVLAKDPTFIKFKEYGADGNYGPTTEKIVAMAKAGFELKDTDGSVITAELINKLQTDKITESYIGLDGKLFEKFNVEAATSAGSSYTPKKSTPSDTTKKEETGSDKKEGAPVAEDATAIDAAFGATAKEIADFLKNKENFSAYTGTIDDDEQGAWDNVTVPKFNKIAQNIKANLVPTIEKIKTSDPDNYTNYVKTLDEFGRLLKGQKSYFIGTPTSLKQWTYKSKFLNPNLSKEVAGNSLGIVGMNYEFFLYLSSGVKKIRVPYDVM